MTEFRYNGKCEPAVIQNELFVYCFNLNYTKPFTLYMFVVKNKHENCR